MDPEDRKKLEKILLITEKNQKMIKKIRSEMVWNKFWKFIYWCIILIVVISVYFYIEPFFNQFISIYEDLKDPLNLFIDKI